VGLIVKNTIKQGAIPFTDVSPFYINVDAKYLSRQHQIPFFSISFADGQILEVSKLIEPLTSEEKTIFTKHVVGKEVRFYVSRAVLVAYDSLYLDNSSWSILRDVGIFPDEYELKVRINKIEVSPRPEGQKQVLEVYPYRDVEAR